MKLRRFAWIAATAAIVALPTFGLDTTTLSKAVTTGLRSQRSKAFCFWD